MLFPNNPQRRLHQPSAPQCADGGGEEAQEAEQLAALAPHPVKGIMAQWVHRGI